MSVNKVILVGNLGADPETKSTTSGTAVVNLRIATTERTKSPDGEWTDHTEWHRVVCFGRTAENVAKYTSKGRQLYIEGRLRTRKWQDASGADRWSTEIVGDTVQFLGGGGAGGERDPYEAAPAKGRKPAGKPANKQHAGGDDDVPF